MKAIIQIFAKAPEPGYVKTRLLPFLTAEQACRLHQRFVLHTIAIAHTTRAESIELWCTPDTAHPFFAQCAMRYGVCLYTQQGEDLGERMAYAQRRALSHRQRGILIGTDCPALDAKYLQSAADELDNYDALFAPTEDGGYALVAARQAALACFSGIAWGTAQVMSATRERLTAARAHWLELPTLWDVDTAQDYARLQNSAGLAFLTTDHESYI